MLPTKIKTVFNAFADPEFIPTVVLSLLVVVSSSLLWFLFGEYLVGTSGSLTLVSLATFVSLVIAGLASMILSNRVALMLFSVAVFLPAFWFAPPSIFILAFLIPIGVLFLGLFRIREENASRIRLSVRRSLAWGAPLLVASFSLGFALFYFCTVRPLPIDVVLPRVSFGPKTGGILTRMLSLLNPDFRSADVSNLTVDEFLRATNGDAELIGGEIAALQQRSGASSGFSNDSYASGMDLISLDQVREDAVLSAGRDRFSHLIGRKLSGNERMADVLSEIVNRRVASFSTEAESYQNLVPSILAIVVFLTVYSTISLLSFLWIFSVRILFSLLRLFRLVRVVSVPAKQEVVRLASFGSASSNINVAEEAPLEVSNQEV